MVDAEYPSGPLLEFVEQLGHYPIAGMNHHVGASDFGPYLLGQCTGTPRQMGVGDEQKTHGFSVPQSGQPELGHYCPPRQADGRSEPKPRNRASLGQ